MANSGFRVHVREAEPSRGRILGPPIHATRHDNLWRELPPADRGISNLLPSLQERKESECQPVRAHRIRVHDVVENVLL